MANLANIARPYALAAFECAHEKGQLPEWKAFLESAAYMAKQASVVTVLANPEVMSSALFDLFQQVLTVQLNEERKNFLRLLAQNKRLMVLPEIAESFNACYAQLEKISKVRVVTAIDTTEKFQQTLVSALTKRIKRDVILECDTDPSILGGAIIHIGDHVIDGSIRGKLTRLLEFSLR
jgi:F-type H+-transporting ATPase subunit delta